MFGPVISSKHRKIVKEKNKTKVVTNALQILFLLLRSMSLCMYVCAFGDDDVLCGMYVCMYSRRKTSGHFREFACVRLLVVARSSTNIHFIAHISLFHCEL